MTAPMRSCSDCPARTDCMASVVARGPLLHGCDDGEYCGPEAEPEPKPERPPTWREIVLRSVSDGALFRSRDLARLGLTTQYARNIVTRLAHDGFLEVTYTPSKRGGPPIRLYRLSERGAKWMT